jgi:transposase
VPSKDHPGGLEDPPVDGGYTGRLVEWAKEELALVVKVVKRSDDASGFVVLPRRWVVDRTLRWLMRSPPLARDHERLPETSETFILWPVTMVMSRCLARHYSPRCPDRPRRPQPARGHPRSSATGRRPLGDGRRGERYLAGVSVLSRTSVQTTPECLRMMRQL